jgi:hypothetical protein
MNSVRFGRLAQYFFLGSNPDNFPICCEDLESDCFESYQERFAKPDQPLLQTDLSVDAEFSPLSPALVPSAQVDGSTAAGRVLEIEENRKRTQSKRHAEQIASNRQTFRERMRNLRDQGDEKFPMDSEPKSDLIPDASNNCVDSNGYSDSVSVSPVKMLSEFISHIQLPNKHSGFARPFKKLSSIIWSHSNRSFAQFHSDLIFHRPSRFGDIFIR